MVSLSTKSTVTAFAPATCANVAVGFDILGFAIRGVGDQVTLTRRDDDRIEVELLSEGFDIPTAPEENAAAVAVIEFCKAHQLSVGLTVTINKGIPISSGLGGSAASAVAAVIAMNGLLEEPLPREALVEFALAGEEVASGARHGDNVVPCLLGGLTLLRSPEPLEVLHLPTNDLLCSVVHPQIRVNTRDARAMLKDRLPLSDYVHQSANLATTIAALYRNEPTLLKTSLHDVLIEKHRAGLVPGFEQVQQAALDAGALGASLSGSGPSLFAITDSQAVAEKTNAAMMAVFQSLQIETDGWVSPIGAKGARIIDAVR